MSLICGCAVGHCEAADQAQCRVIQAAARAVAEASWRAWALAQPDTEECE